MAGERDRTRIASKVQSTFIGPQLTLHLDFMESELARDQWFAGPEFTAADVQMSFPLEAAALARRTRCEPPTIDGVSRRIHARPAYQRALERGGPYAY
jgi:glutathione S-transferase